MNFGIASFTIPLIVRGLHQRPYWVVNLRVDPFEHSTDLPDEPLSAGRKRWALPPAAAIAGSTTGMRVAYLAYGKAAVDPGQCHEHHIPHSRTAPPTLGPPNHWPGEQPHLKRNATRSVACDGPRSGGADRWDSTPARCHRQSRRSGGPFCPGDRGSRSTSGRRGVRHGWPRPAHKDCRAGPAREPLSLPRRLKVAECRGKQ